MAGARDSHWYRVFGLTVRSTVELPELPVLAPAERDAGEPDVEICHGAVEPAPDEGWNTDDARTIAAEPGRCRITFETIGTFLIADGERIEVDLHDEERGRTKVFRRLLEGQVLAVLLHQRGLLVLHASAVHLDGRAAVFLGPTGAGKTTTAAACYSEGFSLLDDDVVALDVADGQPVVRRGVPELKLLPDPAGSLGIDVEGVADGDNASDKQYHFPEVDDDRSPVPLGACYRLRDGDEVRLEAIPPQERVVALVTNTYTAGLLEDTEASAHNLDQCATVAEAGTVQDLYRPRQFDRLPEIVEAVSADLRDAAGATDEAPAPETD